MLIIGPVHLQGSQDFSWERNLWEPDDVNPQGPGHNVSKLRWQNMSGNLIQDDLLMQVDRTLYWHNVYKIISA